MGWAPAHRVAPPLQAGRQGPRTMERRTPLEPPVAIGEPHLAQQTVTNEDFEALLMDSFIDNEPLEGTVVKGKVVAIEKDLAIIDVGLKTEGRIALKEFGAAGRDGTIQVGAEVEV